jgi:hypothetical protein
MKKLAVALFLSLAFNVAHAAPVHGGNPILNLIQKIQSKISDLKSNVHDNIRSVGHSAGGGGGVCR